jgi:hypothetical protein
MNTSPRVVAEARQVDAWVGEACGHGVPGDLAERVLLRVREVPTPRRANRLLVAAVMLGGVLAVVGVSLLHAPAVAVPAEAPQDPKPPTVKERVATVTTADVAPKPNQLVDLEKDCDAVTEILRIAKAMDVPLVMTGGLKGTLKGPVHGLHWRVAIARLAASAGAGVNEFGSILAIKAGATSLPYDLLLSAGGADCRVEDFAKVMATRAGVALVLAGDVHGVVRFELKNASWRDALDVVAQQLGCVVEGCGAVLVLRKRLSETVPVARNYFTFVDSDFASKAVPTMASILGLNIVVAQGVQGSITMQAKMVPPRLLLEASAHVLGLILNLEQMRGNRELFQIAATTGEREPVAGLVAENVDLQTFAELVRSWTMINVPAPLDAKERLSVFATGAPLPDLLRAAASATGRRLINDPKKHELRIE